jgi:hypothetical protein
MGYIKDEHWIIEADYKVLQKVRNKILTSIEKHFEDEEPLDYSSYVPPVVDGLANGVSFLYLPADGSKEGWTTSNNMDDVREDVLKFCIAHNARAKSGDKISIMEVVDEESQDVPRVSKILRAYYDSEPEEDVDFISISSDETKEMREIRNEEPCPVCKKMLPVEYGKTFNEVTGNYDIEDKTLACVKCDCGTFLVGVNGKYIQHD